MAHLGQVEATEVEAHCGGGAQQVGEDPGQDVRGFDVAEGGEQEQPRVRDLLCEMAQDEQRWFVTPVDVVEDDDRAARAGDATHRLGQVLEDPEPVRRRLDVTGQHGFGIDSQRTQHLAPGPVRRRTLAFHEATPADGGAAGEGEPGQLLGQSGLADTRFADAENEAAGAVECAAEPRPKRVEFAPPTDDGLVRAEHRGSVSRRGRARSRGCASR